MDTLDRYLLREFLVYFFVTVLGLVALYLVIDFFSRFWSSNLPFNKLLLLYVYKVPEITELFVPVAVLMSTLLVTINLSRQNEMLAIYAGGMGQIRITSTFITIVSVLSTISFLLFDSLVPTLQKKQFMIKRGIESSQTNIMAFFPSRSWYREENRIYQVGSFDARTQTLEDVSVYYLDPRFKITERVQAHSARYTGAEWILEDGLRITYPDDKFPAVEKFTELGGLISYPPARFEVLFDDKQYLRLRELRYRIQENRALSLDTTKPAIGYHERLAVVFSPLIFALLAIPLGSNPFRNTSNSRGVGYCFFIVLLYLVLFRLSLSLGKGGHLSPIIAGWTPNVLFLAYALYALKKSRF